MTVIPLTTTHRLHRAAASLIQYAEKNPKFLELIAAHLKHLPTVCDSKSETISVSPYLVPNDEVTASARLTWLVGMLQDKPKYETAAAIAVLEKAVREIDEPKALVIGLIGFAVPFIDLGLIKKKKKKRFMRIIVDERRQKNNSEASIINLTHKASGVLLANELRTVFGNSHELEPELAEWLFSDHEVCVYPMKQKDIAELIVTLKEEELPFAVINENNVPTAIALSPSINEDFFLGEPLDSQV